MDFLKMIYCLLAYLHTLIITQKKKKDSARVACENIKREVHTHLHVWHTLHSGHCQPARFRGVTLMSKHMPW